MNGRRRRREFGVYLPHTQKKEAWRKREKNWLRVKEKEEKRKRKNIEMWAP